MKENNILLAEFLGLRAKGRADHSGRVYDFTVPDNIELIGESDFEYCSDCGRDSFYKDHCFSEDLLFHSDWNWLMLVVEKIFNTDAYYKEFIDYNSSIVSDGQIKLSYKIKDVYLQCIEFVKWYNDNKQ